MLIEFLEPFPCGPQYRVSSQLRLSAQPRWFTPRYLSSRDRKWARSCRRSKVTAAFDAGTDYDLVTRAGGKPILLVFIHDLLTNKTDEPSLGLAYVLMQYAAERHETGLVRGIVCTTDDVTALRAFMTKVRRVFPKNDTPIGISPDGLEGPGAYGLNRNVRMTVLIAKDNKVTASFALVQPSIRADAPKILAELVKVIGGKPPRLWQLDFPYYVSPF